jgi:hypothetical protein
MTPEEVARRWFREVWDEGRENAIGRVMAQAAVAAPPLPAS